MERDPCASDAYESRAKLISVSIYRIFIRMRTTLDLPPHLVEEARSALGFTSKTDTVVFALREVVRRSRLDDFKSLMGKIDFEFEPMALRKKDRRRS